MGPGYQIRTKKIRSILIHSTNNPNGNTEFNGELTFLYNSKDVTAEYLVGASEVVELLDPLAYFTYHAGTVRNAKFSNAESIGVEVHYSPKDKEQPINKDKIINLTALVRFLMAAHNLTPADVSMHRWEATPKGRKIDPSFWNDTQFEQWRKSLLVESDIVSTILNGPQVDSIYLYRALNLYAPKLRQDERDSIVSAYNTYGELTTIGNLYPFAQAAKETAWFTSERFVKSRNMAGLGATNDGAWGGHFDTISAGVLAQYAHLLCYAVPEMQLNYIQKEIAKLSPRRLALISAFGLGSAGNRWVGLNGKWAFPGHSYGESVLQRGDAILKL